MSPRIRLVNDTIVSVGREYAEYTPHEHNVRDAMFLLTCALPMLGAGLVLLARDGWWKAHARLSIQTVAAAWLASITAFGVMIYNQHGITTRSTFILAVMHECVTPHVLLYESHLCADRLKFCWTVSCSGSARGDHSRTLGASASFSCSLSSSFPRHRMSSSLRQ